jgi:hypothetical protein
MANAIRPRVGSKTSSTAIFEIARPRFSNDTRSSSLVNYPLFFIGTVVVALAIYFIRKRDLGIGSTAPGVILNATPVSDTSNVINLTSEVNQMINGRFTPVGSAI